MGTDSNESSQSCYLNVLEVPLGPDAVTEGMLAPSMEIRSLEEVEPGLQRLPRSPSELASVRVYIDHFEQENPKFENHVKDTHQLERRNEYTYGTSFRAMLSQWTHHQPGCEEWFQVDSYYFSDTDRHLAKQKWYQEPYKGKTAVFIDSTRKLKNKHLQHAKYWTHVTRRVFVHKDTAGKYTGELIQRGLPQISRSADNRD